MGSSRVLNNAFDAAFTWTVGIEGGYSDDSSDKGNWTGGSVGAGELKGTKFGISAAAYPDLDIQALTLDQAKQIYQQDYWDKLPPNLSYWISCLLFDTAVNHGVPEATIILQSSVNTVPDGLWGPNSETQYQATPEIDCYFNILNRRLTLYRFQSTFQQYAGGWIGRLIGLAKLYAGRT